MNDSTAQDAIDGAALRRLRETLSTKAARRRGYTLDLHDDGSFGLSVTIESQKIVHATGATIAEVADVCEASLQGHEA